MKNTLYKRSLLLLITLIIALSACEKKILIDLPKDKDRPVLNAVIEAGDPVVVYLSKSKFLKVNEEFEKIENAKVDLFEDDVYKETLSFIKTEYISYYTSKAIAGKNKKYKIVVNTTGLPVLEGVDVVPDVSLLHVENFSKKEVGAEFDKELKLDFSIKNLDDKEAFYRISFTSMLPNGKPSGLKYSSYNNNITQPVDYKDTFASHNIEKPHAKGSTQVYSFTIPSLPNDDVYLEVTRLSPSLYKYVKTSEFTGIFKDDFTAEKVVIFSNITNGLGIVGGMDKQYHKAN